MSAGSAGRRVLVLALLAAAGCGAERDPHTATPSQGGGPYQWLPGDRLGRDAPTAGQRLCAGCAAPADLRFPSVTANAAAVDFGPILVGARRELGLQIRSGARFPLHLRASISSPVFSVDVTALEPALEPGGEVSLSLEAGADAVGFHTGTLAIADAVFGTLLEVPLSVDVVAPVVILPAEVEFGTRPPGTSWKRWVSLSVDDPSRGIRVLRSGVEGQGFGAFAMTDVASSRPIDATVEAEVTFAPTFPGEFRAELVLELSDPAQPTLRIPVHGAAVNTACVLQEYPTGLRRFEMALGLVRASTVHRRKILLLNAGSTDCLVWDVANQPGTSIPVRATPPYLVEPGGTVALDVDVWAEDRRNPFYPDVSPGCPRGQCQIMATNAVEVFHSRSSTAPLRLVLEAGAFEDFLVSDPEVVEFEAAPGSRETRRVRVFGPETDANRWGAASYLAVTSDSSPAFELEPFDPPPTGEPLDGFAFDVTFSPLEAGPHAGWVELRTAGVDRPLRIELLGVSR